MNKSTKLEESPIKKLIVFACLATTISMTAGTAMAVSIRIANNRRDLTADEVALS